MGNVTQESTALAEAYAAALAELRGLPAPSYLKAGGRRRPWSGPGLPARVTRRRLRLRVRLARRWLREPAMNQPDSIQKSCPGLRREALPGSPPCLGFRSPDGQSETTREPGERPRRIPRADGAGRPPRRLRLGFPGGSERGGRSAPATASFLSPNLSLPPLRARAAAETWDAGLPGPGRRLASRETARLHRPETPFVLVCTAALHKTKRIYFIFAHLYLQKTKGRGVKKAGISQMPFSTG